MSNDSHAHLLGMVEWGTKLNLGLYDFSAIDPSATGDIRRLAKEIGALAFNLGQVGQKFKGDQTLPSTDAVETLGSISILSQEVFQEIEALIPVRELQDAQKVGSLVSDMALVTRLRNELDWNALSKSKTQYLLEHLEALKMTLSVMSQTLYTAQTMIWSRRDKTQRSKNSVDVQRSQLESLIIEQQLAVLRAYKQYDEFRHKVANAPLAVTHTNHSMALIRREDGPHPGALLPYQEPSLAVMHPSHIQIDQDDLARVRSVSTPFVDILLSRWTCISTKQLEDGFRRIELTDGPREAPKSNTGRLVRRNSNFRPAEVETDAESEDENAHRRPKLSLSTPGPVLMPVDGTDDFAVASLVGLGVAVPAGGSLRPPNDPRSPQGPSSWSAGSGSYFPSAHGHSRPRRSPHPSPLSSPRASISSLSNSSSSPRASFSGLSVSPRDNSLGVTPPRSNFTVGNLPNERPSTAFKTDGQFPPPPQQTPQQPQILPIPWRIRVNQYWWEYRDSREVESNTRIPIDKAMKDFDAITEIASSYVSRDAVEERHYHYQRIKKLVDVHGPDGRTKTDLQSVLCIDGALKFDKIRQLVERTEQIRNPRPRSPMPRSPRTSSGSLSGGPVRPPTLERTQTAPSLAPILQGSRQNSTSSYQYSPSVSTNSDSDSVTSPSRRGVDCDRDRKRHDSFSTGRDSSARPRRDSSSHAQRDSSSHAQRDSSMQPRRDSSTRPRRDSSSHVARRDRDEERDRDLTPRRSSRSRRENDARRTSTTNVLTKIAGAAGLATLLDGFADML